jgi:hypothetical protein
LKRSLEKIDKRRQGGLDRLMLEGSELFAGEPFLRPLPHRQRSDLAQPGAFPGESHILEKTLPEL